MPELPDLYVFAQNLRKQILNKSITNVMTFAANRISVSGLEFVDACIGAQLDAIAQDGKEIKFVLSNGNRFYVHLMLLGKLTIDNENVNPMLFNKMTSIFFEDETILTISDEQSYAKIELNPQPKTAPDALSDDFSYIYFLSLVLRSPRKNIKALLLDQKNVRGIGNAYVDEILYNANISPKSKSGKIPQDQIEILYKQIGETLRWGIESIICNTPNIITGETRSFMKVHNKKLRQTQKGEQIIVEKVVSKKTYYTYGQVLYE